MSTSTFQTQLGFRSLLGVRSRAFRDRIVDAAGQTTAEYALVILGAAIVAGLLAAWAQGGALNELFDSVVSQIIP